MLDRGILEMTRWTRRIAPDEAGQDLIEYALLMGFIGVATVGFFPLDIAPSISGIMSKVASLLAYAPGTGA